MKTGRIFKNAVLALFAGFTIVSCNDSEVPLEVLTDVYVINKKFDNEVKSANAYFAYANQSMMSVTVTIPNNSGSIELENYTGSIYTMAKDPKDSDFSASDPVDGSYNFTIKGNNGETLQVPDILNYEDLGIPQFSKIKFSGTPFILELEWADITASDGYVVKIFDLDGELIFNGYTVGPDVNKYTVTGSSGSGYWSKAAVEGEEYVLQINAFTNDSNASTSNYMYNVSEISIGETPIEWGVN